MEQSIRPKIGLLGRIVALKVLHPELMIHQAFWSGFDKKLRLAANLNHPNLVKVYEYNEINGHPFIAMAYMANGSLKDALTNQDKFKPNEAIRLIRQIASGLDYAHQHGVIHRDLKPGNLLLDEEGLVHISDLGFAKALTSDKSLSLTVTGGIVGSPGYMPPELWKAKPASPATDIYSLACIFVEMLSGEPLFDAETTPGIMLKHFEPLVLPLAVPKEWTKPIEKALEKEPEKRFQSVKEFSDALSGYIDKPSDYSAEKKKESSENIFTEIKPNGAPTIESCRPGKKNEDRLEAKSYPKKVGNRWLLPLLGILSIVFLIFIIFNNNNRPSNLSTSETENDKTSPITSEDFPESIIEDNQEKQTIIRDNERIEQTEYEQKSEKPRIDQSNLFELTRLSTNQVLESTQLLSWSDDSTHLYTYEMNDIFTWNSYDWKNVKQVESPLGLSDIQISPDERFAYVSGMDSVLKISLANGYMEGNYNNDFYSPSYLSLSPDGQKISYCGRSGVCRIADTDNPEDYIDFGVNSTHFGGSSAWSPDGRFASFGGTYGEFSIFDAKTLTPILESSLSTKDAVIQHIWSPNGDKIIVTTQQSYDNSGLEESDPTKRSRIFIFNGTTLTALSAEYINFEDFAWSSDNTLLAACSPDSRLNFYSSENGALIFSKSLDSGGCRKLAWSPDGTMLALEMVNDSSVQIWVTKE